MPRSLAGTAITFGLVSVPVQITAATDDLSVRFRAIHLADGGRVRIRRRCELCERTLELEDIGRGYQTPGGALIPVTGTDLAALPGVSVHAVEIITFVPADAIDPVRLSGGSYYLRANGAIAAKPYTLLQQALTRTDKVAVARYVMRDRERLGLLRAREGVLVLHQLLWPDEVRDPAPAAPPAVDVSEAEIAAALDVIDALTTDDVSGYRDHYREALESVIDAKTRAEPLPAQAAPVDLMAALNASVQQARERRGENGPLDG